jgi:hypothetical protein
MVYNSLTSEDIDCRFFFTGKLFDCKRKGTADKKTIYAFSYLLSKPKHQNRLIDFWNLKNPHFKIE